MRKTKSSLHGFTLVEILVVVVILGILGSVVVPQILSRPDSARVQAAQTNLRAIQNALSSYRLDNFRYPSTEQGLEALVTQPTGFPEPKNYSPEGYLPKVPVDPWGSPYIYEENAGAITLFSLGADGQEGGEGINADIRLDEL